MRVFIAECSGRNLFDIIDALSSHLCFGAHLDSAFLFEARTGHGPLSLLLLQLLHYLVLLNPSEIIFISDSLVWIYTSLCRTNFLADAIHISRCHGSL